MQSTSQVSWLVMLLAVTTPSSSAEVFRRMWISDTASTTATGRLHDAAGRRKTKQKRKYEHEHASDDAGIADSNHEADGRGIQESVCQGSAQTSERRTLRTSRADVDNEDS